MSLAIWAQVVSCPCPVGPVPVTTVTLPSGLARTAADSLNADGSPNPAHENPPSNMAEGASPQFST